MPALLIWRDIGVYHAARSRAAFEHAPLKASTLEIFQTAKFAEFRAEEKYRGGFPLVALDIPRETRGWEIWHKTAAALAHINPDVVAIPGWALPECFAAIAWARANGKRLVMMSDSQGHDKVRSPTREAVKSRILRACDAALVAGQPHKDYVVSLGMAPEKVFMGFDVVDNAYFVQGADRARENSQSLRIEHGLPSRYLVVSARFVPKKNLVRLVEAYGLAAGEDDTVPDLVIVGDGPERAALEGAISRTQSPQKIHLFGFKSYDVLPVFYGLSEGLVHVSTVDQWGLVINEATASGVPIVASRNCGAAAHLVVDGTNGFVVDPLDVANIAAALRRIMALSPSARTAMGEASRQLVSEWGLSRFATGLSDACQAAREQPSRRLSLWDRALVNVLYRKSFAEPG